MRLFSLFMSAAGLLVCTSAYSQSGQSVEGITADKNRIIAEKDRITAEKDLLNARADLERARVSALGLPSFENKTIVTEGGAKIEALMLAADALGGAAASIADDTRNLGTFLVLAGDEAFDFARYESLRAEMDMIHRLFDEALGRPALSPDPKADLAWPGAVAGLKAVAGLFASETTVAGMDFGTALPSRVLALAVARRLGDRARLPAAIVRTPTPVKPAPTAWTGTSIAPDFEALAGEARRAQTDRAAMPEKLATAAEKDKAAKLDNALARWKAFSDRAGVPDANGVVPVIAASRMEGLASRKDLILRVRVEQAGGSLVNSKNIATTFGLDPIKVSGASIVSYVVTEPTTGEVRGGGLLSCRSTLTSLRRIQTAKWRKGARAGDKGRCDWLI